MNTLRITQLLAVLCSAAAFAPSSMGRTHSSTAMFERMSGTVKWFNTQKGFGFIVPDDGENDIFVHQTSINTEGFRSLADGERVEYELMTDDNGKTKAHDVTGPNGEDVQGAPFRPANDFGY